MPIVEVPSPGYTKRGKTWVKTMTGVDRTITDGYAFQGEFLQEGELAELATGTWLLSYYRDVNGSGRVTDVTITLSQVAEDGIAQVKTWDATAHPRSWALLVRDEIADLLRGKDTTTAPDEPATTGNPEPADRPAPQVALRSAGKTHPRVTIDPTASVDNPGLIGFVTVIGPRSRITGYTRIWGAASGLPTQIGADVLIEGSTSRLNETVISYGARIGDGAIIRRGASVGSAAIIGPGAVIGADASVDQHTVIPAGLVVPDGVWVTGALTPHIRHQREQRRWLYPEQDPHPIVTVADLLADDGHDLDLPRQVSEVCGGIYRRGEDGVWRYTIGALAGTAVTGASDVTMADLAGQIWPAAQYPDDVAISLRDTHNDPRFAWAEQYGKTATCMNPDGVRAECRLVPLEVWRRAAPIVVDMTAPELTPAALLTTDAAAERAGTTPQGLQKASERHPEQIRPVLELARGRFWSAPLLDAYAAGRRPPGRPKRMVDEDQ